MSVPSSVPPVELVAQPSSHTLRAIVIELYACHYVLRNFGLRSEELYVTVPFVSNMTPPAHHVCVLVRRGGVEAVFTLQQVRHEWQEAIRDAWTCFLEQELPKASEAELDRMVNGSQCRRRAAEMARVLAMRGLLGSLDPELH